MCRGLGVGTLSAVVELGQEILEPVGNALPHHVIVGSLENIPEPPLVFTAEASSYFSYWGVRMHCRLWPMRLVSLGLLSLGLRPARLLPCR
jgi:hypothetical protein